jgi:hypothetical protein
MRSSLRTVVAPLRAAAAAALPLPAAAPLRCVCAFPSRPFSVFSSSSPSDSLSQLLRDKSLLNNDEQLDKSVPLGAPKPSALNKLRQSGRPGRDNQDSQRMDAASVAMRKAMDYKMAKQQAKEKAEAEAAKKAQEEKNKQ